MTYIKDLIEIPETVHRDDFVLRLTDGISDPKKTVQQYVVTPELAKRFDEALKLIRDSVKESKSRSAYLHGSFGSGKSHFMAILHLILQGNPDARSINELLQVIKDHSDWMDGKKFLMVPYHLIGAENLESAILGGYARFVAREHPNAPTPGVFQAESIFKDAQTLRTSMGDSTFFDKLNSHSAQTASGWGTLASSKWNAASFNEAVVATPDDQNKEKLVSTLTDTFFTNVKGFSKYTDLDNGLAIISSHAKELGYNGLILFLDELILWLITRAADTEFVTSEAAKLSKLVEYQNNKRPVPIISLIARQRDIREYLSDHITGSEKESFSDTLKYWEGRFDTITLGDSDLPVIAQKRLLKPISEATKQIIDEEFNKTSNLRQETMNTLLTSKSNKDSFRNVYPFSPALVEAMSALASMMQRDRTALKVMQTLLINQRDTLQLGQIISAGDLYDEISTGEQAIDPVAKSHFQKAENLYKAKLRPLLEKENGLTFEESQKLPYDDPNATRLRNDDRLIKTLLLAALTTGVESLQNLTPTKLAALNHGTIKSPIQGREGNIVLNKIKKWASEVGELRVTDDHINPIVSIMLAGVDTKSIIEQANTEDSPGNRRHKIKDLLLNQLGLVIEDRTFYEFKFDWLGTKRSSQLVFENIREMTDDALKNDGEDWKVVIDYPFDKEGNNPMDDIRKIEDYLDVNPPTSRTLLLVPSFFSMDLQKNLGELIKIDHIMTGDRLTSYLSILPQNQHSEAKLLLGNQQSALRLRITGALAGAYGLSKPENGTIDTSHEITPAKQFQSLDNSVRLQPPVASDMKAALINLLHQALKQQYPGHPDFPSDAKLTSATLKKVYDLVERAITSGETRLIIAKENRNDMRAIAQSLELGEMGSEGFIPWDKWKNKFENKHNQSNEAMTVGNLKKWMDDPKPTGLPNELRNMIIMAFAAQTDRSFLLQKGPATPSIDNLRDDLVLQSQRLPSQPDWEMAKYRADKILGLTSSGLRNATNVSRLAADIRNKVNEFKESCEEYNKLLRKQISEHKLSDSTAPPPDRVSTAQAVQDMIDDIIKATDSNILETLAKVKIKTSEIDMSHSLKRSSALVDTLNQIDSDWLLFDTLKNLHGESATAAQFILTNIRETFQKNELAISMITTLPKLKKQALSLVTDQAKKPADQAPPPIVEPLPAPTLTKPATRMKSVRNSGSSEDIGSSELKRLTDDILKELETDSSTRVKIDWEIYTKDK